jgi:UDP-glucose 4-epimerase
MNMLKKTAKCLVTGHRGYIGSRLFKKLQELGHEAVGIDLKDGNDINSLQGLQADRDGNFRPYWANFEPEYIFHLACIPRVGYSIEHPVRTMKNNVLATSNVLNFARKNNVKRVIYSSSSSIHGDGKGPKSPYALQKSTSEVECKLYSDLYGLDTISLRYFNVYSSDQPADGAYATAVSNWMKYIKEDKVPFITGDGEQRRDMLHVDDAISANIFAMQYSKRFDNQYYDVGTGENVSLNEVRQIVQEYFTDINFMYTPQRLGDAKNTLADTSPLRELGWQTKTNIKHGLNICFSSLKKELENV